MCVTEDANIPQQSPERNERVRLIRHSELTFSSSLHFSASWLIKVQMAAAHLIVAEQIPPQILAAITQMSALSCLSRHLCLPITKCCIRKMCQTVTTGHKLILLIFFCFFFSGSVALAPLLMCAEAPSGFLWLTEPPDERVDTVQHHRATAQQDGHSQANIQDGCLRTRMSLRSPVSGSHLGCDSANVLSLPPLLETPAWIWASNLSFYFLKKNSFPERMVKQMDWASKALSFFLWQS